MGKLKYVCKRIILALITGFIIISLTFILLKLIPIDRPTGMESQILAFYNNQVKLGYYFESNTPIDSLVSDWSYINDSGVTTYFYQKPIMDQYFSWLSNVVTKWDWGTSNNIQPGIDVSYIITSKLPVTIYINLITIGISIPLGIGFGILAALNKNKPVDRVITILNMVLISIPSFVFISMLVLIFGYALNWLPTSWPQDTAPTATRVAGYVLPVASGAFGGICGYQRMVRGELVEAMASDYLLLARTKGLSKTQTVTRHALRNAMVPVLPIILSSIIGVLSGSAILESIYSIPGIGGLFIQAINSKDYNVLMFDMAVFTTIGLLSGIILDLSYGFLDPRIRMGER